MVSGMGVSKYKKGLPRPHSPRFVITLIVMKTSVSIMEDSIVVWLDGTSWCLNRSLSFLFLQSISN